MVPRFRLEGVHAKSAIQPSSAIVRVVRIGQVSEKDRVFAEDCCYDRNPPMSKRIQKDI